MIPKNLNQVTLKRTKDSITGKMGLSWMAHSLKHYGVEEIIDRHFPINPDSHRTIAASRKLMEGALTLIAGGERIEDIEVLRADEGLCKSLGGNKIISPDKHLAGIIENQEKWWSDEKEQRGSGHPCDERSPGERIHV